LPEIKDIAAAAKPLKERQHCKQRLANAIADVLTDAIG
jgi:hypothetical protein